MTYNFFTGFAGAPQIRDIQQTVENVITWGPFDHNKSFMVPIRLSGAARDSGHTNNTTLLRAGLLLGQITASGLCKEWDPTATDGSEKLFGVLLWTTDTQYAAANDDKWLGWALVGGLVKASGVLVPGNASIGLTGNSAYYVRALMSGRFVLDDNYAHSVAPTAFNGWSNVRHRTTALTLTAADNNTMFTNKGATASVTFTLPAVASSQGLRFGIAGIANQDIVITSPTANTLYNAGAVGTSVTVLAAAARGKLLEVVGVDGSIYILTGTGG